MTEATSRSPAAASIEVAIESDIQRKHGGTAEQLTESHDQCVKECTKSPVHGSIGHGIKPSMQLYFFNENTESTKGAVATAFDRPSRHRGPKLLRCHHRKKSELKWNSKSRSADKKK